MKKLIFVLAVLFSTSLFSCGNSTETTEVVDSTVVDTVEVVDTVVVDTTTVDTVA